MPVNADKPHLWKPDIAQSVDFYNKWFMQFAPTAYRETRLATTQQVESPLTWTANLTDITPAALRQHPEVLPILRMATASPIARDRLIGLAGVSPNMVKIMEGKQQIPCGYFDSGYLGYEAAEGIDWVWEHRIEDLAQFGV